MPSFAHKKLIEQIARVDLPPKDESQFDEWALGKLQIELTSRLLKNYKTLPGF